MKIFQLKKLQTFFISHNKLKHIPKELCMIDGLKCIDLKYNEIKNLPLEMYKLDKLEYISLEKNPLTILSLSKNSYNHAWLTNSYFQTLRNCHIIICKWKIHYWMMKYVIPKYFDFGLLSIEI